jgi:transcriptional regulator with XRE-family HTH domain
MNLTEWRRRQGLQSRQAAARLGIGPKSYSRYEAGRRIPRPATLRRIFLITGGAVTPDDFYDIAAWRRALAEEAA